MAEWSPAEKRPVGPGVRGMERGRAVSGQPAYSPEEVARRGDELYEQRVLPRVAGQDGKVVAIDVVTGAYAVGDDALTAARQLRAPVPQATVWLVRIGHRALHRIGGRVVTIQPIP